MARIVVNSHKVDGRWSMVQKKRMLQCRIFHLFYMTFFIENDPNMQHANRNTDVQVSEQGRSIVIVVCNYSGSLLLYADELLAEKEKYKGISEELDETFTELAEY